MIPTAVAPDSSASAAVAALLGTAFWVALGIAVVVRIVMALVRRRPGDITHTVLRPTLRSGAVESEALGWKASQPEDFSFVDERNRDDRMT